MISVTSLFDFCFYTMTLKYIQVMCALEHVFLKENKSAKLFSTPN